MSYLFGDSFDCYAATTDMVANYWDGASTNVSSSVLVPGRFPNSQGISFSNGSVFIKTSGANDALHHISVAYSQSLALSGTSVGFYITLFDGATNQCSIVFQTGGNIILTGGAPNGAAIATYSGAVTAINTWFQFEIEVLISNTGGYMNVRKLGNTSNDFTSATNLDTQVSANAYANAIRTASFAIAVNNFSVDDFLWRSDSVANGVPWVGDIRCQTRRPVSDASVQWTPSSPALPVQTIAFSANSASSNTVARFGSFTAPVSGLVGTVSVTPAVVWTGNVKCSLFASSASTPGAVLGSATPLSALPSGTPAVFTFGTPVAVTAGTQYFIGMIGDTGVAGVLPTGAGLTGFQHSSTTYAAFPIANPPGSGGIAMPVFTANISVTGAPNAAMVQDTVQDAATSYVYSSTVGQSDLYGISSIATTPASIVAVTTRAYLQKSDAGTRIVRLQLKSGGTTVQSSDVVLNTVFGWGAMTHTLDPATGLPWTAVGVNNLNIGVLVQA